MEFGDFVAMVAVVIFFTLVATIVGIGWYVVFKVIGIAMDQIRKDNDLE